MTLKYGENKRVAHKEQLSVTDVSNNAIGTIQANYNSVYIQVLLPSFLVTFDKFYGFPS